MRLRTRPARLGSHSRSGVARRRWGDRRTGAVGPSFRKGFAFAAGLECELAVTLVGQPLVRQQLMKGLRRFLEKRSPEKPLVMSFHGSTGTGKTFVSSMLVRHLFPEGLQSRHVHQFSPIVHFPHAEHVERYKVSAAPRCGLRPSRRSAHAQAAPEDGRAAALCFALCQRLEQRLHAVAEGTSAICASVFPTAVLAVIFSLFKYLHGPLNTQPECFT